MIQPLKRALRILMLEDVEDDVGLIVHALSREGMLFATRQVDSRDEFEQALFDFNPDVILSDHSLPQFNSMEALKICRTRGIDVPFILVTGTVSEEFAVQCLKLGADDYVLKSNLARLPSAILSSLRKRHVEEKKRKVEATLRRQNTELVKINKELDSFVYSVSHNLRAPLMSVLGLVQLARLDDRSQTHSFEDYFDRIEQSINKLDETLKEILDYSRNARVELRSERVDLRSLIDECFGRLQYLRGFDKINREIEVEEDFPLYSDALRLTVIFNNLISNAIKYSDPRKDKPYIRIRVKVAPLDAFVYFEDNGIGVPPDMIGRIFDMFFRATLQSEGAGLGLYIVKEAVDKLNGSISVKSTVGDGTAFQIRLPNNQNIVPPAAVV